jgi:hypothetical protein
VKRRLFRGIELLKSPQKLDGENGRGGEWERGRREEGEKEFFPSITGARRLWDAPQKLDGEKGRKGFFDP